MRGILRVVEVANEQVPITTVLRLLGVELPEDGLGRRKVHCPFGELYHSDGGRAPTMRINEDTNTVYCFNCSTRFAPVKLYAHGMDLRFQVAAKRLLGHIGYQPVTVSFEQAQRYTVTVDKGLLAEALKTYCRRICADWSTRQFAPPVAAALTRCLSLLDLVTSADDVTMWLAACKAKMRYALNPGLRTELPLSCEGVETAGKDTS